MKYDIMGKFRAHLGAVTDISENTQKQYYGFVKKVFADLEFNSVEEIELSRVMENIRNLKTKNDVSSAVNGLRHFERCFPDFHLPQEAGEIITHKRNRAKRQWPPLDVVSVHHKVNALRDKKLKLGYRCMLHTGMRVSEVAGLHKKDIRIDEGGVTFHLDSTKKGCPDETFTDNEYLVRELAAQLSNLEDGDRVFCGYEKMKHQAVDLGIECHDLRRIFAQEEYQKATALGVSSYEAVDLVREKMRHESCRTTLRYIRRPRQTAHKK